MRTRGIVIGTVAAGLALAAVGCGVAVSNGQPLQPERAPGSPGAAVHIIKAKPSLRPIVVRKGGVVRITLPANATTGYSWQIRRGAARILKQLGEAKYNAPDSDLVGASGTETWTFRAPQAGATVLVMTYTRPWEKKQPPADTAAFAVHVVTDASASRHVALTLKRATASVTIAKGRMLGIALPANPSTGYRWTVLGKQSDILTAASETFKAESDLPGAPGISTLHFKAEKTGTTILVLGCRGPGTAGTIDGAFALSVIVK